MGPHPELSAPISHALGRLGCLNPPNVEVSDARAAKVLPTVKPQESVRICL